MLHRVVEMLKRGALPASGYAFWIPTASKHLLRWGAEAPSGTPDAVMYINTAGTTTTTIVYVDVAGTWTALTIS
jgi:hypothetical protein